ncbi:DUF1285 domain-containing protein [Tropicimonas isoalkanivorans]|uniref:Proteophosphoglycan n=1 Tax=Tropicimonas isoalkanivorans TaxID=441112 RepID=A0A1I1IK01_9RHOB|nr:DUF1285 domain-containing protein [Tropicimonas isoalkanivorans]SFC36577.1 hypothetical protein SAMN04488094_104124 [Tropicimonas isoalkanivorans]
MTKTGSGDSPPIPSPESLAEAAGKATKSGGLPPVHLWNPPFCGDLDMEIRRDGTWFYTGTPIGRAPLVRLFSTILRRDGADYFLVTPVEKVGIRVEDVPFLAVDSHATGSGADQAVTFTTNVGDEVPAGPDHPIRVTRDPETGEPTPYVLVRAALEARIDRKTFYRLVEICERHPHRGEDWFGLHSRGAFFPFIPVRELPS